MLIVPDSDKELTPCQKNFLEAMKRIDAGVRLWIRVDRIRSKRIHRGKDPLPPKLAEKLESIGI